MGLCETGQTQTHVTVEIWANFLKSPAKEAQYVNSQEQIRASALFAGRATSQISQFGRNSSILHPPIFEFYSSGHTDGSASSGRK